MNCVEVTRINSEKLTNLGKEHFKEFFQQIVNKNGEGIMLREPQSFYKPGRQPCMRKYKVT
jgi:ATP-dependent DNA ligase